MYSPPVRRSPGPRPVNLFAALAALAVLATLGAAPAAASGVLTLLDQERVGLGGVVDLLQPERAVLSPDGRHLYVSSPVRDDILVFRRDAATGELTFVDDTNP